MTERGTGRTLSMVKALPTEGAIVVVHNPALSGYVGRMIRDVRGEAVRAVILLAVISTIHGARAQLSGRNRAVFIDHAFWESVPREVADLTRELATRYP